MAMVLSSQGKLLVALCLTLFVLAGALAVGSFTGWFRPGSSSDPKPAKLRQGAIDQLKLFGDPNMAAKQCKTDFQGFQSLNPDYENEIDDVERNDYDSPSFREGSGGEEFGLFPPPPPPPDGSGYRGEKGERGPRGPPGESIRGPPGPPGAPGPAGEMPREGGSCSCNITTILKSIGTSDLLAGPAGLPGKDGRPGPSGPQGRSGLPGDRGPMGQKGEKGERGYTGPEGMAGLKGEPGKDGIPGLLGPPGPPGPPGPVEFENVDETVFGSSMVRPGVPGSKGDTGPPGPVGPRGERGTLGSKGNKGDPGPKGERGDRGFPGERGPQGIKGDMGPSGIDGIPGTPGGPGRPAEKGEKGDQGLRGPPGVPGISFNTDESTAIVPAISGPKGERGERGIKGEKGDRGEAGIPGVPGLNGSPGLSGEKGEIGHHGALGPVGLSGEKGEKGEPGPPGAVTIHEGSDKILVVKGEKGDMGRRGRRGKPGLPGPMGPPGKNGPMGDVGLPGWMGRPGPSGLPGIPGQKGEKGESANYSGMKGEKGEKGDRGQDGIPGRDGAPGLPGAPSSGPSDETRYIPVPGPPGPPGPPGTPGMPGLTVTGPKGEPGSPSYGEPVFNFRPGRSTASPPTLSSDDNGSRVPGALVFPDRHTLLRMAKASSLGTMAFLVDEELLVIKVKEGWKYILLGSLLSTDNYPPLTTSSPPLHQPFDASNLINHISKPPADSPQNSDMLRLAALNIPHSGDVRGLRGADYSCYIEARRNGLRGTFRAFLSSKTQSIESIVRQADRHLKVANLKGQILFNSWQDIFKGDWPSHSHHPRIYSFDGKNVLNDDTWPHKAVWHGALSNGEGASRERSCEDWHTSRRDRVGLAGSITNLRLLEQTHYTCDKKLVLLCIEATSEIYVRRRRDTDSVSENDDQMSEEEYHNFLNSIQ